MKKLFTLFIVLLLQLGWAIPAMAADDDDHNFRNVFEEFSDGIKEQSGDLEPGAEEIEFPTFQDDPFTEDGSQSVVGAIDNFLNFFKLIVTPLAVIFIIIMGIKMVTAGSESEEMWTKSKNYIVAAVMGLVIIFMADSLVEVMFGFEGEIFRGGEAGAREFGRRTNTLTQGIYTLVETVIASVAVFVLVTAGLRYVAGSYSDDQIATAKRQITWSLAGLFIIAISEFVVKDVLFQEQGTSLGVAEAQDLIAQVTNFIAGTVGTLAFAFLLYAGYLYVMAREDEESISKAKKIIFGAVVGIILAGAAFAITSTLVELDASR
ncbi:hypothetical protein HOD30_00365 [Candidatus Peregrinibacteria bacterium]|jgi:type IV secretory pathway VirB2 component (pilin)|nr:hypothetical protein [Candidatus Peregrinibacteria bacterium]MBT4632004.1 hypothetical protein [Candidatus Peregrinibacteria bacterium]MBT5516711.1 hypothetical protein [Candidatus Peregrinibacteria bacterium]MBT5823793.1 hypothetical protein [Candidatus Peregrinibacteria bacterium]